ncbi:MAG: M15 family metallopeptidase, partial [Gammaproteobacteria bacterium]
LGARPDLIEQRGLALFEDAPAFEIAHVSASGREHLLVPDAAAAWKAAREAAESDEVTLLVISGFRSFDRQLELISAKVARGESIDEILRVMAPPGCSEHHTGRAVDVGTPGCEPLSETFELTDAYRWLDRHAQEFGFKMSYPRDNRWGFTYEPWHWCYQET